MDGVIADASLAPAGERKIDWVAEHMPVLRAIRAELVADGSVRGRRIAVILPVEPKTAYLAAVLAEAGTTTWRRASPRAASRCSRAAGRRTRRSSGTSTLCSRGGPRS
jgi:S-adenosylhomocysteine hydrolase